MNNNLSQESGEVKNRELRMKELRDRVEKMEAEKGRRGEREKG